MDSVDISGLRILTPIYPRVKSLFWVDKDRHHLSTACVTDIESPELRLHVSPESAFISPLRILRGSLMIGRPCSIEQLVDTL